MSRGIANDELTMRSIPLQGLTKEQNFQWQVITVSSSRVGLFVVDPRRDIFDWGQDLRRDDGRLVIVFHARPRNRAVMATTATANGVVLEAVGGGENVK